TTDTTFLLPTALPIYDTRGTETHTFIMHGIEAGTEKHPPLQHLAQPLGLDPCVLAACVRSTEDRAVKENKDIRPASGAEYEANRSEEHTSEIQSPYDI